ncbi:MAG: 6-hydroxymethylpterin diphosphokinase MptE-like protein [Chloroflexota bacterium]|nr:6-hydroxymethylpterin diphosphokinase MptE-like protein [Chloroflexota bacterium]
MSDKIEYDKMLEKHPEFEGVIHRQSWDYIGISDKGTVDYLQQSWIDNVRANISLWEKCGDLTEFSGFGKNKAIICIGAGPSLAKNQQDLHRLFISDCLNSWRDRNFLLIASNHQYKPLLKQGIIPDFVILADGSDVVMDHLINDVPSSGQHSILLAGLHCSHDVLSKWADQGKAIKFYLTHSDGVWEAFEEETNRKAAPLIILQGGNVLNSAWSIGLKFFGSTVFMAVGNDLSYEIKKDLDEQRTHYYADKDYSANLANRRDDAHGKKQWLGFTIKDRMIIPGISNGSDRKTYDFELNPVGTSPALWVYKTWIEANVLANANKGFSYHYYNCTEGGIAGVMCKDMTDDALNDEQNWFMMDDVCKRWHTMKLKDAAEEFLDAKENMVWGNKRLENAISALGVNRLGQGQEEYVKDALRKRNGLGLT